MARLINQNDRKQCLNCHPDVKNFVTIGERGVALSVLWAALLGASLGLDRNLRDLSVGFAPCAFWGAMGAIIGVEMQYAGLAEHMWAWPLTCAACAVSPPSEIASRTSPLSVLIYDLLGRRHQDATAYLAILARYMARYSRVRR